MFERYRWSPKHQQERLIADRLAGAVDGVPEAFLGRLDDEGDLPPDFQDAPGILLEVARQLVVSSQSRSGR